MRFPPKEALSFKDKQWTLRGVMHSCVGQDLFTAVVYNIDYKEKGFCSFSNFVLISNHSKIT